MQRSRASSPVSQELKDLLSEGEMRSARGSSLNAQYTALLVIGAMWTALAQLGSSASLPEFYTGLSAHARVKHDKDKG